MPEQEHFNKKLLVEGNEDKHVILALRERENIPKNFEIIDCKGIERLFRDIPRRIEESDIEVVGVIIDADDNLTGRWQRISQILLRAGFNVPENIPETGLLLTHHDTGIKVGIWIMPDNNINGMLEDFMRFLIPAGDDLLPIANDTLSEIERQNFNRYSLVHKSKALIHTWLAWQEEAGKPLGQSITMRYLNTDNETCARLLAWIRTTFQSE